MKRYKHSLSHYRLLTCDLGELVPCGLTEVLPGDTIQHSTSVLLRMSPLIAPVMHPVQVRVHHFFVPHRLNYSGWEDFITGGQTGEGSEEPFPTNAEEVTPDVGSLLDYLGVPTGNELPVGAFSLLPIRAYNKIYNEYYRDQDMLSVVDEDALGLQRIAWEKDYFTTCRPWTQRGPAVTLPLGTTAPVSGSVTASGIRTFQIPGNASGAVSGIFKATVGGETITGAPAQLPNSFADYTGTIGTLSGATADLSGATAATVNQLRLALALQRYQEARAQYGARYTEYLRYLGIRSADQRLDRPEYLGGGRQTVSFSEVLRTGSDVATSPIGDLKGHGIAALRSNRYRYFVEEHGYIMTLLSLRPKSMYIEGIPRTYLKRSKEDFYQKELELIGQQPVYNSEVYMQGTAADAETFGYQDRYAEYRHTESSIHGDFRSTLNFWHMARDFASLPTLNGDFTNCDPGRRNFAVQTNDVCWVMVNHNMQARRMVGNRVIGRIL